MNQCDCASLLGPSIQRQGTADCGQSLICSDCLCQCNETPDCIPSSSCEAHTHTHTYKLTHTVSSLSVNALVILCAVFCLSFGLGQCRDSLDTLRSEYLWQLRHLLCQINIFLFSSSSFLSYSIKPFAQPPYTTLPASHPAPLSRFGLFHHDWVTDRYFSCRPSLHVWQVMSPCLLHVLQQ